MNQELALGIMLSGRNCFLTGAAGSGKTYILNKFISECKRRKKKVAVTASTGIAATHLNGNTIHSWSGIGGYDELPRRFFDKMPKGRREMIQRSDVLVIDEVSMLHGHLLDLIDKICTTVRGNKQPFGGLQVVISGDFFQLPPVIRKEEASEKLTLFSTGRSAFCVHSEAWQKADFSVLYLTEQHRQDDAEYLAILNSLREGNYRRGQIEQLMARVGAKLTGEVTELSTHNYAVDRKNHGKLEEVSGEEIHYEYQHTGAETYHSKLARNILAPEILRLKKGALVMAVKNVPDKGYFNGSTGVVVGFEGFSSYPVVEFRNGRTTTIIPETWELIDGDKKRASVTQVPLRLAWAITVHKSQGMTLDSARIDLSRAFERGMGYVALSRVKSLEALSLVGINRIAIEVSQEARELNQNFQKASAKVAAQLSDLAAAGKEALEERKKQPKKKKTAALTEDDLARKQKWAEKVQREREKWPNARKPWSIEDSLELVNQFVAGQPIPKLVDHFGRKPRSIMMRLNDSFGEEVFSEDELWGR